MADWLEGLTYKDWLFDGRPMRNTEGLALWHRLDWSKARVDMGPSTAGNFGPYWHVPLKDGDTTHRLYPKLLQGKWARVVQRAITEALAAAR